MKEDGKNKNKLLGKNKLATKSRKTNIHIRNNNSNKHTNEHKHNNNNTKHTNIHIHNNNNNKPQQMEKNKMETKTKQPKTIEIILKQTENIIKNAYKNGDTETATIYTLKYDLIKNYTHYKKR